MPWNPPEIPAQNHELEPALRARIDHKTKPPGSLGMLEDIALRLGVMQGTLEPVLRLPRVLVFAGDHGFASEGVSPFPAEVTPQMVMNFLAGGAAINVFARQHGLPVTVIDAGVAADLPAHPHLLDLKVRKGTRNARRKSALTPAEVRLCLDHGIQVAARFADEGSNALLFGEMGIGNSSAAALIYHVLLGLPLDECVGRGAGHDDAGLEHKRAILRSVVARHDGAAGPFAALEAFGGCEIAMMAGAMLGAAARRMLIVVDGFIVTSALAVAAKICPRVTEYCLFGHASAESVHARVVAMLGGRPLLDLGLRLGEGTGAALAWPLIVASAGFLREMATFESAGVSDREDVPVA